MAITRRKEWITVKKLAHRRPKSKPWFIVVYEDLLPKSKEEIKRLADHAKVEKQYVVNYEGFKTKKDALEEMERLVRRIPTLLPFKS